MKTKAKMLKTAKLAGSYQAIHEGEIVNVIPNPFPPTNASIRKMRYPYLAINRDGLEVFVFANEFTWIQE